MKNKIVLSILIMSAFIMQGQEYSYVPYVQEGSIWSYVYRLRSGIGPDDYTPYFTQYEIKGDTCINSDCYKKLFRGCPQNQQYYGALREQDKKVYFFENGNSNSNEELIYDFSLETGDTFLVCVNTTSHTMVVSNIDTVQIYGNFRKRFYFRDGFGGTQIEGIGSIFYFREPCSMTLEDAFHDLNYKKENDRMVYYSTEAWFTENDCVAASIENAAQHQSTILFQNSPNPFSKFTIIKYQLAENIKNAKICIYDLNGLQLKCFNLTGIGEGAVQIQASDLKLGMYLYSLLVNNQIIDTKRMVLTE